MAETVNYLSYYHSPDIENLFILRLRKNTDKDLKNHYIISMKTSITNAKTHIRSWFAINSKSISYKVVK